MYTSSIELRQPTLQQANVSGRAFSFEGSNLVITKSADCTFGANGFDECHCNACIDAVIEMDGIKKDHVYFAPHLGHNVKVDRLYPFKSTSDCFIYHEDYPNHKGGQGYGFCQCGELQPCR